jgi:hypothetical protein
MFKKRRRSREGDIRDSIRDSSNDSTSRQRHLEVTHRVPSRESQYTHNEKMVKKRRISRGRDIRDSTRDSIKDSETRAKTQRLYLKTKTLGSQSHHSLIGPPFHTNCITHTHTQ